MDTLTEPSNQSASIRQHLAQQSKRLRPILSNLAWLDIAGRSDESNVNNLAYLARVYSSRTSALPDKHGCEHKKMWRSILEGDDRKRALGGLEATTLLGLRAAFKRGSAWVSYSSSYRDPDDILISSAQWAQTKRRHYDLLSASESPEQMLKRAQASLEAGLGAVSEALAAGRLHIDQGHIRMEAMNALPPLPEFDEFERKLFAQVNAVQRPEILLEMDSQTRFSWILLGRPAENKEELGMSKPLRNPADGFTLFNYSLPTNEAGDKLVVFNMLGSFVKSMDVNGLKGTIVMNTSELTSGIYLVSYMSGNKVRSTSKLVVRHN